MTTSIDAMRVKALYNGEHRRFSLHSSISFGEFQHYLLHAFNVIPGTDVHIKYRDTENDLIIITCDSELREAIVPNEVLKVELSNATTPSVPELNVAQQVGSHTDTTDMLVTVVLGYLVVKTIPIWAVLLGAFTVHRHVKRNPLVKQRIMNFFHSRRIGLSNRM